MDKLFYMLVLMMWVVGCQTAFKGYDDGTDVGVWEGKIEVLDRQKGKTLWGQISWVSESRKKRLRADVTAVFDAPIATFILQNGEAHLWLYQEEKYYYSQNPAKLFAQLTKLNLDPQIFFTLLSKQGQLARPWSCRGRWDKAQCNNSEQNLTLQIENDGENQRRFRVKNVTKSLQIELVRSKVEVQEKMFEHRANSQFEKHTI